jgi:LPS-assembly protein
MFFRGAIIISLSAAMAVSAQAQNGGALEAREIFTDSENGLIRATGDVTFSGQGRVLATEALTYDRAKKQLNVPGTLRLTEKNGDEIKAGSGIIDNALEKGRFTDLSLTTINSGRLRAAAATRDDTLLQLDDAFYTSCPACDTPDGDPLWQIRASRIAYDRAAQNVIYAHPRLEVYGLPVFYLPYLAHAGPEVTKRSGFLTPGLAASNDFGFAVDTPYFFNLAPHYDLTVTPRISEKQEPFVTVEWRHLTAKGRYALTGYLHRPQDELAADTRRDNRMGLTGNGQFTLGDWALSFAVQEASDDLFFRRYKISDSARLSSNIKANRTFGRNFFGFEAYKFRETVKEESAKTVNSILPSLTHRYDFASSILGGNLRVSNRLSHRLRNKDVDETRLSSVLDWSWRHITQGGFVISADNRLTLDAYDFSIEDGDENADEVKTIDDVLSANSASLTLAYPLQRMGRRDRQTLSPKLQLVLADADDGYENIPHISAATRELTRSQLFQLLDAKDETNRVNIGLDHELDYDARISTRFFIGQSYNLSSNDFDARSGSDSGFGEDRSALITEAGLTAGIVSFTQKARFSEDGTDLLRSQANIGLAFSNLNLGLARSFYKEGQFTPQDNQNTDLKEATANLGWQMNRYWQVKASLRENLATHEPVRAKAAFTYEDECTIIAISFDRDYARFDMIEPDTSINFTFTLKTLGN